MSTRNGAKAYCITNVSPAPKEGPCDGHTGVVADLPDLEEPEDPVDPGEPDEPDESTSPAITYMQTLANANCPSERTVAVDARGNRTHWVKKIGSNRWMMSDLAYAGGGANTYGDTVTLSTNIGSSYTSVRYYTLP